MKKGFARSAALLLILVLVTMPSLGGTFAKYITAVSAQDGARVAYWGFQGTENLTLNLFETSYTNIQSKDSDKVIAPGQSQKTPFTFEYRSNSGVTAPEVRYQFTVDVQIEGDSLAEMDGKNILWELYKGEKADSANLVLSNNTSETFCQEMEEYLTGSETGTAAFNPGDLPPFYDADNNPTYWIGWNWPYETGADDALIANDGADTGLGVANLTPVTVTLSLTATQLD